MGFLNNMGAVVGAQHANIEATREDQQKSFSAASNSRQEAYITATKAELNAFVTQGEELHAENGATILAQNDAYEAKITAIETLIAQDGDTSFDEFDAYLAENNSQLADDVKAANDEIATKMLEAQGNWGFGDADEAILAIQNALSGEELYEAGPGAKGEFVVAEGDDLEAIIAKAGAEEAGE